MGHERPLVARIRDKSMQSPHIPEPCVQADTPASARATSGKSRPDRDLRVTARKQVFASTPEATGSAAVWRWRPPPTTTLLLLLLVRWKAGGLSARSPRGRCETCEIP